MRETDECDRRLAGKRPSRSVDIVAQGRAGSRGRFRTFADGAIGRDGRFAAEFAPLDLRAVDRVRLLTGSTRSVLES